MKQREAGRREGKKHVEDKFIDNQQPANRRVERLPPFQRFCCFSATCVSGGGCFLFVWRQAAKPKSCYAPPRTIFSYSLSQGNIKRTEEGSSVT